MKIDGGCHCGFLTYEAEIDPGRVLICHCTDCQVLSGSAFRVVVPVSEENFQMTSGAAKIYIKTADSGNQREQGFCPDCGTQIYATSVGDQAKIYGLRVGTCKQRDDLPPASEIWCESRQTWVPKFDKLPNHAKQATY